MTGRAAWSRMTAEQLATLRAMAGRHTAAEISVAIGRTVEQVRGVARRQRITLATYSRLSPAEVETLRRMAGARPVAEIAAVLGRSIDSVYQAAFRRGLSVAAPREVKPARRRVRGRRRDEASRARRPSRRETTKRRLLGLQSAPYVRRFAAAGWSAREIARLFDLTAAQVRLMLELAA